MIVFHNEPKRPQHETGKDSRIEQKQLVCQIGDHLSAHDRFKGKEVAVTFIHKGSSLCTCIVQCSGEKFVFKIIPNANAESNFLKVWEEAGVTVPHVLEEGSIGKHEYILREYVDAPTLAEAYDPQELFEKGIYREIGQSLRLMHTPKAKGYGRVIGTKAAYSGFGEWLAADVMARILERIAYTEAQSLIGREYGSIRDAFNILQAHVSEQTHSSYCHNDLDATNIFATRPITVFDPSPTFNNGYIDLGRSLITPISQGVSVHQFLEGYFAGNNYSERTLHAAVLLNTYLRFGILRRDQKKIENMQKYLIERKGLIG